MSRSGSDVDPAAATVVTGSSSPSSRSAAPAGGDRYVLLERLGAGAMGVVWAAHDVVLDRRVALKVLHAELRSVAHQERLAAEARTMARLSHRNVVAIYDVGERDGQTYLTMELVRGVDLGAWLATPRSWREIVDVFRAAGAGLAAAHAAGVIHRDIKPSNILIGDDGEVHVADFGVAHAGSTPLPADAAASASTATHGVIGSPAYMATAQLRGEPADQRSDQFSFCVALYEALHGRRPFSGATGEDLCAAIDAGPPPPVREVPGWLHAAVARGLAADPERRFASMDELIDALDRSRRRRGVIAGVAAAAIAGAAGLALALAPAGDRGPSCDAVGRELDGIWGPEVRAETGAGFAALGPWGTSAWSWLETQLDHYAADWTAARRRTCEAKRAGRARHAEASNRCLDDRRHVLHQLVRGLANPDVALVDRMPQLVRGLPVIGDCESASYLDAIAIGEQSAAAREDFALARIHDLAGRTAEVAPLLATVIVAARAADDPGLEAEALILRSYIEASEGRSAEAVDSAVAAVERSARARAPWLRVDAWIAMSAALQEVGKFDDAARMLALAAEALEAAPDPRREARRLDTEGIMYGRQGQYAEALKRFEAEQAILVELDGFDAPTLAPVLANASMALRRLDRFEDALARMRRSLELYRAFGDGHPEVARARSTVGEMLVALGRHDEALVELDAAIAGLTATLGAEHQQIAWAERARGEAHAGAGRIDEAIAATRRAVAIFGDRPPGLASRTTLAGLLMQAGHLDEAEPLLVSTLDAQIAAYGGAHPAIANTHAELGELHLRRGQLDEASAQLDKAESIFVETLGPAHSLVAEVRSAKARVAEARGKIQRDR